MLISLSAISYEDVKVSKDIIVHLPKNWVHKQPSEMQHIIDDLAVKKDWSPEVLLDSQFRGESHYEALSVILLSGLEVANNNEFKLKMFRTAMWANEKLEDSGYTLAGKVQVYEETIDNIETHTIAMKAYSSDMHADLRLLFMFVNSKIYFIKHHMLSRDSKELQSTTDLFSINQPFTTSRLEFGAWSFKKYEGGIMMYSLTDDEKQRITFNCMPNKRKVLAYREKKSPAYSQADYKKAYGLLDSINVMGWDIEYVDGFVQDENYAYILLPLPKDFVPKSDSNGRIIIKGKDHALELQTEYELLKDSLEVTFDNCLEGVP